MRAVHRKAGYFRYGCAVVPSGDGPVLNLDDAVGEIQHAGIMRDDHNCAPALVRQFGHHLHDIAAGVGIERSRGLIGEDDSGIAR